MNYESLAGRVSKQTGFRIDRWNAASIRTTLHVRTVRLRIAPLPQLEGTEDHPRAGGFRMRSLQRRLSQLEAHRAQLKPRRVVVRFEGCGWEKHEEPKADIDESDENPMVVVVQYVERPAKSDLGPTG
jgi:hypothetical protein